jgi:prephenate dehydratase
MQKEALLESLKNSAPNTYLPVSEVIKMIKGIDSDTITAAHVQLVTENVLTELIKEGSIKRIVKKVITTPTVRFPFKKYLRRGDNLEIAKLAKTHSTYVSAILNGRKPNDKVIAIAERYVREKYQVKK